MEKVHSLLLFLFIMCSSVKAQTVIPLYESVPNSKKHTIKEVSEKGTDGITRISKVSEPSITIYHAGNGTGSKPAVIICPGGGYQILAYDYEGYEVAEALNKMGITGIVLKYRLPEDSISSDKTIAPLQDAQRAIQLLRTHAGKWNIDPSRIGIMGFSAGGHLASTASTHFTTAHIENPDSISLRPDYSILIYPVISFNTNFGHQGSRNRLIGNNASQQLVELYSNELQVNTNTPPAFLVHAADDKVVPATNSIRYFEALVKNNVRAELHIYQQGGHGFGLKNKTTGDDWTETLQYWMKANNYLK